jgi:hypothetical protein
MPHDTPEARVLVSDSDREHAVDRLQRAYTEGRLTSEEMESRLERALRARSHGDLRQAVADLPEDSTDDVLLLGSKNGKVKRTGDWQVPRRLRIDSTYGGVELDLSTALVGFPEIEIDLRLDYGSATVVVPDGATVNVDGVRTEWGRVICKVPGRAGAGRPHVRIIGELGYGRLRVRHPFTWFKRTGEGQRSLR